MIKKIPLFITLFCFLTTTTLCYVDPNFEACEPKTCGNQTISYPFYIKGIQEPFCGFPGFGLSCDNTIGFPILNLSNSLYTINQIFYQNQSLRVSNAVFSRSNTKEGCLLPTSNLSIPITMFSLAHNQTEVNLFFGCDSTSLPRELQMNKIGCSAGNKTNLVVALYERDTKESFVSKNCMGEVVKAMVENVVKGGIEETLRKGFRLNWIASNCSDCTSSGGRCGFNSDTYSFRCYCTDRVHAAKCETVEVAAAVARKSQTGHVMTIVGSVIGVTIASLIVLACWFRKKIFPSTFLLFSKKNPTHQIIEKFLKEHGPLPATRYNYSDIKKITNSFKNKLGQGGYGSVYKGKLHDERIVALKILNESKGNGEDFMNEVASMSRTSHVNVVRLIGFCLDGSKKALLYEFMPNGSLEKFIYEEKIPPDDRYLACKSLYDIVVGVAQGLEYLHRGCDTRILHFDIKPHNILLDDDFCPKISDFGLAKICPRKESIVSLFGARGTPGYIAPELFSRNFGGVSHKSDVYSYGMMVLEMVGQRKNIKAEAEVDCSSELYFPHWIYKRLELNQDLGLKCIKNESDKEMVRKMIVVSLWCIQTNPLNRPSMHKVVEMLEGKLQVLEMPPKPFLSSPSPVLSSTNLSSQTM